MDSIYLKRKAIEWLKNKYPNSVITTELAISSYGKTSVDVAAIVNDEIIGIEIKGDGDSPSRLELQGPAYSLTLQKIYLLPSVSLKEKCLKKCPFNWGWGFLDIDDKGVIKIKSKAHYINCNSPEMLLSILWTNELKELAKKLNIKITREDGKKIKPRRDDYISCLVDNLTLPSIRKETCNSLFNRNWNLTEKKIY